MTQHLALLGAGVVTDALPHLPGTQPIDPAAIAAHDALSQLALAALHQAWTTAHMEAIDSERIALIVQSAWGTIDSTRAYLDSMFDAAGRYASPRHFSRSVYSSVASNAAIHFGIRGPCETLVFAQRPVLGPLHHAWRLLAADRCTHAILLWADQSSDLAADLATRAVHRLHRPEFQRYTHSLGQGAIALIAALPSPSPRITLDLTTLHEPAPPPTAHPFPLDAALTLLHPFLHPHPDQTY